MKNLSISLCMIVKDEEKSIRKCLESVTGIVDEIIIVDTGSKDNTVDICNKYGAKVFHFDWVHDFAAARNFSIEQASSDYILILDADEYLMGEIKLQEDLNRGKDYYVCTIKNFNSIGRAFYHKAVRLFKNNRELRYYGKLHEHLNTSDSELNLLQDFSHTLIGHDGYRNEIVNEKNKLERNFNILVEEVRNNPTGYNLYNMGQTYMLRMEFETALDYFKRAYKLSKDKTFALPLLNSMIECLQVLKRYDEGIILGQTAVEAYPHYADFYFELARNYEGYNYLKDAEMCYRKCLELGDSLDQSFAKEGVGGYLTNYHLANLYFNQRDYHSAFDSISLSLQENKLYQPSLELYLNIMLRTNISNDDIIKHLNSIYSFTNVEEIKTVLIALCKTRHPILTYVIDALGEIFTDKELIAISQMYSGLYEEARHSCESIELITIEYATDLILLACLLKDEKLLIRVKNVLNINNNEWKFVSAIVNRDNINYKKTSLWIENTLLQMCKYCIILNEFDQFEYLSEVIFNCSIDAQYELAKLLNEFGFNEVSSDVLNRILIGSPRKDALLLLADINVKDNNYEIALSLYNELKKYDNDYSIHEKIYCVYEKLGEINTMHRIKDEMREHFPLTKWIDVNQAHIDIKLLMTQKNNKNKRNLEEWYKNNPIQNLYRETDNHFNENVGYKKLRITYIMNHVRVCGGVKVIIEHTKYLVNRGHSVTIVCHSAKPEWIEVNANYIQVPLHMNLSEGIPESDIVITTVIDQLIDCYFNVKTPIIHFEQGDTYIFEFEKYQKETKDYFKKLWSIPIPILAVSNGLINLLEKNFNRRAKLLYNALDSQIFYPKDSINKNTIPKLLVVGAEQTAFKGISDVMAALDKLKEEGVSFETTWVTPQNPNTQYDVEIIVNPTQSQLGSIYRNSDIYISGSYYESFALPALEAMTCGCAVVSTKNQGILEYGVDNENCLLFEKGNISEMVHAIKELIFNKDKRESLVRNGFVTSKSFTWEKSIDKLEMYLYNVLTHQATNLPLK